MSNDRAEPRADQHQDQVPGRARASARRLSAEAPSRTAGIDLATEPARTAVAVISWAAGGARLDDLRVGAVDADLLTVIREADITGVDCPFGWPDTFVSFLGAHRRGTLLAAQADDSPLAWRRSLAYRLTDTRVREDHGVQPLSVAADRIALTAMRCASLLARLETPGAPVQRGGGGQVCEVYPAVSLKVWGLPYNRYKGLKQPERERRLAMVQALQERAPWWDFGEHRDACIASDDALDAVVAGLTARAAAMERTTRPAAGSEAQQAAREGWIHVPQCHLGDLADPAV